MGYFSWTTLDGEQSISNIHSKRGALPVVLLVPEEFGGVNLIENEYAGYGEFGGFDAFALLAKWNEPNMGIGVPGNDRGIGIAIGGEDEDMQYLKYPLRFVSLNYYNDTNCKYEDFEVFSCACRRDGYYYIEEIQD